MFLIMTKCDVQGVVLCEYNAFLFINHIPEGECDVPTRCRGQVPPMADNKWDICQLLEIPLRPVGRVMIKFMNKHFRDTALRKSIRRHCSSVDVNDIM